jgi:predicted RecB family nuclease
MKSLGRQIRLSATDLTNHLACRHATMLDLRVARGETQAPHWAAPHLAVIRELGKRHEVAYLAHWARKKNAPVENLDPIKDESVLVRETLRLMEAGAELIAQGALADGNWFGRPDLLRRVANPSAKWGWSYEVEDTKLALETKAGTVLQLCLYSELLAKAQGCTPEVMWVIPPGRDFQGEAYRVGEYAAYFRYVKSRLERTVLRPAAEVSATYPEPVPHCEVCRWFRECDARLRADDHLSLVAGIRRQQRTQLEQWDTPTMAKLAVFPIPLRERPEHGSREAIERVREQARVQVQSRTENRPVHEALLPPVDGTGFCRLPEPSPRDVFLDLEGDPFAGESGMQYLFGFAVTSGPDAVAYEKRWALNRDEEKQGFEWLMDQIMARRKADPAMRVYHFGAYEPAALKRLTGLHATRENAIDELLRAGIFVDLHQAFKQAIRAGVEEYSLKKIEVFYNFERKTPLDQSRLAMRYVEHRLELGWGDEEMPPEIRQIMEGYNSEDCVSALQLRNWLEQERKTVIARGTDVPRLPEKPGEASKKVQDKLDKAAALTTRLCEGLSADPNLRSPEQSGQWLLAQLLSWHRREDRRAWQEGYRLADSTEEELLDERVGLTKMSFVRRVDQGEQVPVDRYSFDPQRTIAREGKGVYFEGQKIGEIVAIDREAGSVDIKKTKKSAEIHPSMVYAWDAPLTADGQAGSLYRIGEWVAQNGVDAPGKYRAGRDLLLRKPPRLLRGETLQQRASETPVNTATRIVLALADSAFAIQGPPGSGKTYTGARMICDLVRQGKKIGVTALGHKVIRNLLDAVVDATEETKFDGVCCLHRETDGEPSEGVAVAQDSEEALEALRTGAANVVGGTSWLWSPEAAFQSVDVLFIDEAGQMALADVLAVSQAAAKLVLLGDPQQLERPLKGSHPEGAEKSALEHLLNGSKTIPGDMGFLLPQSWRLHPSICEFTSPVFYEDKLTSHPTTRPRVLQGHPWLTGAGLWFVPVAHQGNRNSSPEEIEAVASLVEGLLKPEVRWFYGAGNSRRLKEEDVLIVAPYNAQVADLSTRLPKMRIGTVDKFQGQEAPVVIYSLATSSPADAPRGMEFLYSLNRLNVATSRAQTAVILVGSPLLFEPECRTPRQMLLASAFCQFAEMAQLVPDV